MFALHAPNDRYGLIYLITHRESGKQYVGQTMDSARKRWSKHNRRPAKGRSLIHNAARKHGAEAFDVEVLDWAMSEEELDHKERFWIAFLETKSPLGYNLLEGGSGCARRSEESKAAQAARMRGRPAHNKGVPHTEEHKSRIGDGLRRRYAEGWSPHEGYVVTAETRRKLSEAGKGRALPPDHPWRQPGHSSWNKGLAASEEHKRATIAGRARHYAEHGSPTRGKRLLPPHSRAVMCVETGVVYSSQLAAAQAVRPEATPEQQKAMVSNISKAVKRQRVAYGYHWRAVESSTP